MNKPLAIAISVAVPLLVVAGHGLALLNRPPQLNQVVAELGSIGRFYKDPVPNHAGTRLLFIETTDRGFGVFLGEISSGKRNLLFEQVELGPSLEFVHENLLGWAPDDSSFAYIRSNSVWQVVICDGQTGATQSVVPVDNYIPVVTWLTPHSFAFADEGILYGIRRFNGQWLHPLRFKCYRDPAHKPMEGQIEQLSTWGDGSVVWQQGGVMWKCGEDSEAPVNVFGTVTTATMDAGIKNTDATWYEMGYNAAAPETGLPVHGSTFVSQPLPDHSYTMAPDYTANNAVLIDADVVSATLTLKTPAVCSKISFLTAAGIGPNSVGYVVHHADTTMDAGTFVAPDWFSSSNAAFIANGRNNAYPHNCEAVNSGYPRLYSADVTLGHSASPVTRIDFAHASGKGHAAIFAVSGAIKDNFTPMPVTGYNADLIVEATPVNLRGTATTATMDGGIKNTDFTWYEMGHNVVAPDTGLPVHDSVFVSRSAPNHAYRMPPDYTANNAVLLNSLMTNGALTFKSAAAFSKLSFLTTASDGANTIHYAVHHADNTLDSGNIVVPDWFDGESNPAIVANGCINVSGHSYGSVNSGNPKTWDSDVVLEHSASPITQIDFGYVSGNGQAAIFAVSGATTDSFSPIPVTGYNADLIVEADPASPAARTERSLMNPGLDLANKRSKFVIESLHDEPAAIWQYNPGSSAPRCVVPNVEKPFRYVKNSPIEQGVVTNTSGEQLAYYLLSPVHDTAKAIHPLVLAILGNNEMGFTWSHNHEAFANCGAYFVSVDRQGRGQSQWADDAFSVYKTLASKLAIDTNHVYLYGDSGGVGSVYSLLSEKPGLWRGAILFSPGYLPDPSQVQNKPLFFDCGGSDGNLGEQAIKFQDEAAKAGTVVTLLIHPGLGHVFRIPQLERERMREALVFFGAQ